MRSNWPAPRGPRAAGVEQPVGVVLAAQVGAPAHAGAQLQRGDDIGAVVGVQAGDAPVLDVGDQEAAPPTVVRWTADADQALFPGWRRGRPAEGRRRRFRKRLIGVGRR